MRNDCMLLYLLNDKVLQKVFFLILEREKKYFAIYIKNSSHQYVNILEIENMYF